MYRTFAFPVALALVASLAACNHEFSKMNPLAPQPPAGFTVPLPPCVNCELLASFAGGGLGSVGPYDDNMDCPCTVSPLNPCTNVSTANVAVGSAPIGGSGTGGPDGNDYLVFSYSAGTNDPNCGIYTLAYVPLPPNNNFISPVTYTKLRFWLMADRPNEAFTIQLAWPPTGTEYRSDVLVSNGNPVPVFNTWHEVVVPLSYFPPSSTGGPVQLSNLREIDFEGLIAGQSGTIYIDDLRVEP